MPSTKSLYVKWLIVYIFALLGGVLLAILDYETPYIGIVVAFISLLFIIYYAVRAVAVRNIEKKCVVGEGRFVGAEQTSLGWRSPKFSLTIELNVHGEKVLVKTAGVYSSYHISGLTTASMIKVGYTKNFEQVITL